MSVNPAITTYARELETNLRTGRATEHTHRPALKTLLQSLIPGSLATNEPTRVECGAPDFVVEVKGLTTGYVEAKDLGTPLEVEERSEQLTRYRRSLGNLLLTDYNRFRWYVDGAFFKECTVGTLSASGRIAIDVAGAKNLETILTEFASRAPQPLTSPHELSSKMARITLIIRDTVGEAFARGVASEMVKDLRKGMAKVLLPDIDQPDKTTQFADIYAQSLVYGLFAAWTNHRGGTFSRAGAAREIPKTNPFLRRLFDAITGVDIEDEPYLPFIEDLVQVLAISDVDKVLAGFGARARKEDPLIHFYETYLAEYDPSLRSKRGVFFTPEPVVSFIVRAADDTLRGSFGLAEGLADASTTSYVKKRRVDEEGDPAPEAEARADATEHRVLILDPACGTGGFLYGITDVIRERFQKSGNVGMWRSYVRDHLLPRLFGFEVLMAPYTVAHIKLALQLGARDLPPADRANWAFDFSGNERTRVYLTNSLDEPGRAWTRLPGASRVLSDEATEASTIKDELPIMVVVGNPPYQAESQNRSWEIKIGPNGRPRKVPNFIGRLLEDYYSVDGQPLGETNPRWLQDDYVKFIRWAEWRVNKTGSGILAFITNRGYLENLTFRGMRWHLMETFDRAFILDLHGDVGHRDEVPGGGKDENVFDIKKGVAIGIFVKLQTPLESCEVFHAEVWGTREHKYGFLSKENLESVNWTRLTPSPPQFILKPRDEALEAEFLSWPSIDNIFPTSSVGILTARDDLTVQFTADRVWEVASDFVRESVEGARTKYNLGRDVQDWSVERAQADVRASGPDRSKITRLLYRPFDWRYTYFTGNSRGFICRPRTEVTQNMIGHENLVLISARSNRSPVPDHFFCADCPSEAKTGESTTQSYAFPLYLYPEVLAGGTPQSTLTWTPGPGGRVPNLDPGLVSTLSKKVGLKFVDTGRGDLVKTFGPEDLFHYMYAVFFSTGYRTRYGQFLKTGFPRLPLTSSQELFAALASAGEELTELHLLRRPVTDPNPVGFPVAGTDVVDAPYPRFRKSTPNAGSSSAPAEEGRVSINAHQYFRPVESEVWEFSVGGYRPCEKWLKDRQGRELSFDDKTHFAKIVSAIRATLRTISRIDSTIPRWPID
ncbi:MAG TPA: type ISP restriction/modification enzyme [Thermoplasmata archaeon]|jgi:hypothetical protein